MNLYLPSLLSALQLHILYQETPGIRYPTPIIHLISLLFKQIRYHPLLHPTPLIYSSPLFPNIKSSPTHLLPLLKQPISLKYPSIVLLTVIQKYHSPTQIFHALLHLQLPIESDESLPLIEGNWGIIVDGSQNIHNTLGQNKLTPIYFSMFSLTKRIFSKWITKASQKSIKYWIVDGLGVGNRGIMANNLEGRTVGRR